MTTFLGGRPAYQILAAPADRENQAEPDRRLDAGWGAVNAEPGTNRCALQLSEQIRSTWGGGFGQGFQIGLGMGNVPEDPPLILDHLHGVTV